MTGNIKTKEQLAKLIIGGVSRKGQAKRDDKSLTSRLIYQEIDYNRMTLSDAKRYAKILQTAVNTRIKTLKRHEAELKQVGYDIHNQLSYGLIETMVGHYGGLNSLGYVTLERKTGERDDQYRNRLIGIMSSISKFFVGSQSSYTDILDFAHKSISGLAQQAGVPTAEIAAVVDKLGFAAYINALQMAKQLAYDVYDSDTSSVVAAIGKAAELPPPDDPWYGMTFVERLEQAIIDLNRGWTT